MPVPAIDDIIGGVMFFKTGIQSIVCEEDPYFLRLVSYIHLNPLCAGMVDNLEELDSYPWCGHGVIMNRACHWLKTPARHVNISGSAHAGTEGRESTICQQRPPPFFYNVFKLVEDPVYNRIYLRFLQVGPSQ